MNKLNTTLWHMHIQWWLVVKVVAGAGSPRQPDSLVGRTLEEKEKMKRMRRL